MKHLIIMVACMLGICSCDHKELCMNHSHMVDVDVVFDWSHAPDADPVAMVVQFFRVEDGRQCYRCEFSPARKGETGRGLIKGGKVRVPAGEYRILFHNNDIERMDERGDTYAGYEIVSLEQSLLEPMDRGALGAPPRPGDTGEAPVRGTVGDVWGGRCEYLEVQAGVSGQSVTLSPARMAVECTVELRNVKNMSDAVGVSAALTGMAEGLRLADNAPSGMSATVPFALRRTDDHTLEARFQVFGHCPVQTGHHFLSVYTSGKTYYDFDVTDQIHVGEDASYAGPIHIVIDAEINLPSGGGEGMSPSISGWEEITIELGMN